MTNSDKRLHFLRAELNEQTAQMQWIELLRFFASGTAIYVSEELDLIEVGAQISLDNKAAIEQWMQEKRVARVTDEQAKAWLDADASMWTVVVKPWLLVQSTKK
jgi:hypothetical protein